MITLLHQEENSSSTGNYADTIDVSSEKKTLTQEIENWISKFLPNNLTM